MAITIYGRNIGQGAQPYLIAEAADAHYGSIDMAIALCDLAFGSGADAVKFQHHIPDEEMLRDTPRSSNMGEPLYDFLTRCALKLEQHKRIKAYCDDIGLDYLCTPFSWAAAQEIEPLVPAFKVGSGESQDYPYLERLAGFNKPLLVSVGMSTHNEVAETIDRVYKLTKGACIFLHCCSEYPPRYEDLNLDYISILQHMFPDIGYSDHTPDIWTAIAAVGLGACVIEKHITLSPSIRGPDAKVSITGEQLLDLNLAITAVSRAAGSERMVNQREKPIREWAFRSIVFTHDLPAGTVLTQDHLWSKRPGTGILSKHMLTYFGKTLAMDVKKDQMLTENLCV